MNRKTFHYIPITWYYLTCNSGFSFLLSGGLGSVIALVERRASSGVKLLLLLSFVSNRLACLSSSCLESVGLFSGCSQPFARFTLALSLLWLLDKQTTKHKQYIRMLTVSSYSLSLATVWRTVLALCDASHEMGGDG